MPEKNGKNDEMAIKPINIDRYWHFLRQNGPNLLSFFFEKWAKLLNGWEKGAKSSWMPDWIYQNKFSRTKILPK